MRVLVASAALLVLAAASSPAHADGGAVEAQPPTKFRSKGALITGVVLLPVGVAATVAGVIIDRSRGPSEGEPTFSRLEVVYYTLGIPMALAGLILIPYGAARARVPAPDPAVALAIALGPTGATLRGRW